MNILQPIVGPGEDNVLFYEMLLPCESVPGGNAEAYFQGLEQSGEIKTFNREQLVHALRKLEATGWFESFRDKIAVNLSLQTLDDLESREQILEVVRGSTPEARAKLILEITEHHRPEYDMASIGDAVRLLRGEGCQIAIDDYRFDADPRDALVADANCLKLERPEWLGEDIDTDILKKWIRANQDLGKTIILEGARPHEVERVWDLGANGAQVLKGTLALAPDLKISSYFYPKPAAVPRPQLQPL